MTVTKRTVVLMAAVLGLSFAPVRAHSQQDASRAVHELAEGVQVEIIELQRVAGDLVHLTFAIDNQTSEAVDLRTWGVISDYTDLKHRACGVLLLDLVNLKRHTAGNCSAAGSLNVLPAGSRREYWAQYQAPPADVTSMTVQVPDAAPFYDYPLAGRE
jgi:hypothetical protein